ncbi:MAG: hypothetical protein DME22_01270 [Verrucomicrobia bacterium]|nr:MAG: hypothetical protein DME22_01270 [Verrucomicrobiota bacterium]PYK01800.1 MAG: hypothetical protein DME23_03305 [Verrucomicrobiota bacterium]
MSRISHGQLEMRPRRSRRREEADFMAKVRVCFLTSAATNAGGTAGKPPGAIWLNAASGMAPVHGNYP